MPRVADVALLNLLLPSSSVQKPMSDLTVMCGQMCTPFHAYGVSGWAAGGNFGMGGRENPAVRDDGALFPPPGSNRPGAVSLVKLLGVFDSLSPGSPEAHTSQERCITAESGP